MTMSMNERAVLKTSLDNLDAAQQQIEKAMEPFRSAMAAIETIRDDLLTTHDVEVAGECEGCGKLLFAGEMGLRCNDGPILCEECAPTWEEAKFTHAGDAAIGEDDEMRESREYFNSRYAEHIAAGGSPDDKMMGAL